jgi:flagellar motor protein MotB
MNTLRAVLRQQCAAGAFVLAVCVTGCGLVPVTRAGTARPLTLPAARSSVLIIVTGAVTDTLTSVLFGLGQYTLAPAALPQLRRLLHLLTVTYPGATASIDGYTDNVLAPGGNLQLSQRRAAAVLSWLPPTMWRPAGCRRPDLGTPTR